MYWPVLEFFIFWGLRLLYRMIDQRSIWPSDPSKTHCKTIQAFQEIYNGPEFTLHYKYSFILVVVFISFTFGSGLPILFPVGFLSLLLFYVVERLMIAYSYQKPPMYGSKTNQATLKMMSMAPILYCCGGAWFYSS